MVVKGHSLEICTAVKYDAYFVRLFGMIDPMVGQVPHLAWLRYQRFIWDLLCITLGDDIINKGGIVRMIFSIL